MAQLSTWTNAMRKTGKESKLNESFDEEDYEEEFEEFEEESVVEEKKSKAFSDNNSRTVDISSSKVDSLTNSLTRSIADPRTVRIQRVLKSGILNLQMEKFTHLNLPSISQYDFYLSEIRNVETTYRQIGVPSEAEFRDVEVATEDIVSDSQSVQFCYSDDTDFYKVLDRIQGKGQKNDDSLSELPKNENETHSTFTGTSKLSQFLDLRCSIFDIILNEKKLPKENTGTRRKDNAFLGSDWVSYGISGTGSFELIRDRDCTALRLSTSNILTLHPYPLSSLNSSDLKPMKVITYF